MCVVQFLFTNPRPDEKSIAKYYKSINYLSHSKQRKNLTSFLYNTVKGISLKSKYKIVTKYYPSGSILDLGCGTGDFLNYFENRGWQTTGIEPTPEPRNYAINTYKLKVYDISEFDKLNPKSFDVVTMWHVLEHVHQLKEQFESSIRVLKDNGLLIIALPNQQSWDAQYYKNFWAAYDVPRHLYHFTPETFKKFICNFNLQLVETLPMRFDSFYVSLLSEQYKKSKAKYLLSFFNGMRSNFYAGKSSINYSSMIYLVKKNNSI